LTASESLASPTNLRAWREVDLAAQVVVGEGGTGALADRGASSARRRHDELPSMFSYPTCLGYAQQPMASTSCDGRRRQAVTAGPDEDLTGETAREPGSLTVIWQVTPGEVTILIDDTRSFHGRQALVARSSASGVALLNDYRLRRIEHLWLDHGLGGTDTIWPVVHLLEDASLAGTPFDIGLVHAQAARSGPAHRIVVSMRRCGYRVERSQDLRLWSL